MMRKLSGALVTAGGVLAALSIALLLVVMSWEVFARYVVGRPTYWAQEIVSYLLVAGTSFGAAYTLRVNAHIAVDILVRRLPASLQEVFYRVTILVTLTFSLVLLATGVDDVRSSLRLGEISLTPLAMPLWIPQGVVPLGAALLVIQSVELLFSARPREMRAKEA